MGSKVGIKLRINVHRGRLPRGVLDHEEQLGDDLNDVTRLEDKVSLPLHSLG